MKTVEPHRRHYGVTIATLPFLCVINVSNVNQIMRLMIYYVYLIFVDNGPRFIDSPIIAFSLYQITNTLQILFKKLANP